MALSISQTAALQKILKPGMRICSLGYPDIIAPIKYLPGLEYRADSEAICRRHGLPLRQIPDAESYFALLGCKLDVYDIVRERGCEIEIDLNYPVPMMGWTGKHGIYDVVLDVGTAEHCFNIGQAIINMASLVKEGGYIIHENPHSGWGNHGFYSLHPTWYHDFYETNGFKLLNCHLVTRDGRIGDVPHTKRFQANGEELNIFALAQRVTIQPFTYPQQTKYATMVAAQAAPAAGDSGERAADARAIGA